MARTSSRNLWTAKLTGGPMPAQTPLTRPQAASRGAQTVLAVRRAFAGCILGIDPSLRGTGLALVEFSQGRQPLLLSCETVKVAARVPMSDALGCIHRSVTRFLREYRIVHVAMEQTIYVQNFQTAQILGAARGAAMAAVALAELPVFEYPPLRVKQAVSGAGRASKEQMARTVMGILGHGRPLAFDEADAVAVALCHAFTWHP